MVIIGKKAVKSKGWSISTNLCHEFFVHCAWKAFIQALCTPGYHTGRNVNIYGCLCKSVQQKLFVDNIFSCKKTKQKLKLIMNYFITTSFNRCNKRWKDFEVSFESYSIFHLILISTIQVFEIQGRNWRVGRVSNCPSRFLEGAARQRRRAALLLVYPDF